MFKTRALLQSASEILYEIGVNRSQIKGKKEHIIYMKPRMEDTDYLLPEIKELEEDIVNRKAQMTDQLNQLIKRIEEL